MSLMNYPPLNFNCVLASDRNAPHHYNVRYLQIGFQDNDEFTGWVQDYSGAGEHESFFVLGGQPLGVLELGDNFDGDLEESYVEKQKPGLCSLIFKKFDELVTTAEFNGAVVFYPNEPIMKLIPQNYQSRQLLSDAGRMKPINGFCTRFY